MFPRRDAGKVFQTNAIIFQCKFFSSERDECRNCNDEKDCCKKTPFYPEKSGAGSPVPAF
jgi:hypothetical protein